MLALGRTFWYWLETISIEVWISLYLLSSTCLLMKMPLGACCWGKLLFLHWAFLREGLLITFQREEELEKVQSNGSKTFIEGLSSGIWHTSWISMTRRLQSMNPSGLSSTFCSLVTTFHLVGATLPFWSVDKKYCYSGHLC